MTWSIEIERDWELKTQGYQNHKHVFSHPSIFKVDGSSKITKKHLK
jgi:hypothetical protein